MNHGITLSIDGTVVYLAQEEPEGEEEHEEFEAHNPWLPETSEIIWGGLSFLVILAGIIKFAWPAIKKAMQGRTERIAKEIADASTAKAEAERKAADIRAAKGDIEAERTRLLAEADEAAERMLVEGRARLENEVAELQARAEAEIAGAGGRIAAELQAQVASLAMETTERVVAAELNDTTQTELLERFIARVGAGNGEVQ